MLLQLLGLVIASTVLVHVVYVLSSDVRQRRGTLRILHQAVAEARESAEAERRETQRRRKQTELSWTGYRKFEVERKIFENENRSICTFDLVPHDKRPLPDFRPGQFLTFGLDIRSDIPEPGARRASTALGSFVQERQHTPTVRCYSMSDCPRPNSYRVTIKRIPSPPTNPAAPPGLASNFFHEHVEERDILDVKAPSGNFFLDVSSERPVVLIGGGVGVTPVLSMLNTIVASGSKRETWFFYGVRNGTEQIAKEHFANIAREHENVHLHLCYSQPLDGDVLGKDYHHAEHVSVGLFKRLLPSSNYQFYLCGPPSMMTTIHEDLTAWGVPEDHIKFEAFGPATVRKTRATLQGMQRAPAVQYTVNFSKSGKVCESTNDETVLLELAEANGVIIDSGCRVGNCNTCLTAIKEGGVTYIREPDTMPEEGSCLTCIAIPNGDLVLDA